MSLISDIGEKKKSKGHAPVHQNKFAFRHNKFSTLSVKIENIPNCGICEKCHTIIEWKKKYRKYKPRTTPGKCPQCDNKNILYAYHVWCLPCSMAKKVCAKCLEEKDIHVTTDDVIALQITDDEALEKLKNSGMKLRDKLSILRDFEKGEITPYEIVAALNGTLKNDGGSDSSDDEVKEDDEEEKPTNDKE